MAVPQRYGLPPVEDLSPQVHRIAAEGNAAKPQIFVDPQSLKIPRLIRGIPKIAAVALSASGRNLIVAGANEILIVHTVFIDPFTASATVGTRALVLRILDETGSEVWRSPESGPTAGQSYRAMFMRNFTTDSVTPTYSANVNRMDPLPDIPLPPKWAIALQDRVTIDAADTVQFAAMVESFTFPRGLANNEIPMGLESGFLWDLAEPRKVA